MLLLLVTLTSKISKRRNLESLAKDPSDHAVDSLIADVRQQFWLLKFFRKNLALFLRQQDTTIEYLAKAMYSGDPATELAATRIVRKCLACSTC